MSALRKAWDYLTLAWAITVLIAYLLCIVLGTVAVMLYWFARSLFANMGVNRHGE